MAKERTLILVKPDGVAHGHIGEVITRLEHRNFEITALTVTQATQEKLEAHYRKYVGTPIFDDIAKYMYEGPIVAMIASGTNIVTSFRKMTGATNPKEAIPGTIRGDFGRDYDDGVIRNVVHSSDSVESAEREIKIWFPELAEK